MTEAAYTPGPWRRGIGNRANTVFDDQGRIVADCTGYNDGNLIAAAPDYHAIICGLRDELGFAEWSSPEHAQDILSGLIEKWSPRLRAAIAKATGAVP